MSLRKYFQKIFFFSKAHHTYGKKMVIQMLEQAANTTVQQMSNISLLQSPNRKKKEMKQILHKENKKTTWK